MIQNCKHRFYRCIFLHVNTFDYRWGFCDDANGLPSKDNGTKHKYFEVESTLLPNEVCNLRSSKVLTTKQCTGYVPHKPAIYEFYYDSKNKSFELQRYLGGYYRDFVPRIERRRSRIRYDFNVSTVI